MSEMTPSKVHILKHYVLRIFWFEFGEWFQYFLRKPDLYVNCVNWSKSETRRILTFTSQCVTTRQQNSSSSSKLQSVCNWAATVLTFYYTKASKQALATLFVLLSSIHSVTVELRRLRTADARIPCDPKILFWNTVYYTVALWKWVVVVFKCN